MLSGKSGAELLQMTLTISLKATHIHFSPTMNELRIIWRPLTIEEWRTTRQFIWRAWIGEADDTDD